MLTSRFQKDNEKLAFKEVSLRKNWMTLYVHSEKDLDTMCNIDKTHLNYILQLA